MARKLRLAIFRKLWNSTVEGSGDRRWSASLAPRSALRPSPPGCGGLRWAARHSARLLEELCLECLCGL